MTKKLLSNTFVQSGISIFMLLIAFYVFTCIARSEIASIGGYAVVVLTLVLSPLIVFWDVLFGKGDGLLSDSYMYVSELGFFLSLMGLYVAQKRVNNVQLRILIFMIMLLLWGIAGLYLTRYIVI